MWRYISLVGILFLISCSADELEPGAYIRWVDDPGNGLLKEYTQGNIRLTCQYTPADYVSLKQSNPEELSEEEVQENTAAVSDMLHFKLRFEDTTSNNFMRNNYTTPEEFNRRSMYLGYDIQYDLKVVQGEDTAKCVLNHHERTYGSTPYETLLVSFPKTGKDPVDTELIFTDRVFGLGRVKFFFSEQDLESIPTLIL